LRRTELFEWLKKNGQSFIDNETILYSFWFDAHTSALIDYKLINSNIKVFTRVHGSDLYENDFDIPFRNESLRKINKVFLISKYGLKYLSNKYPKYKKKYYFCPLGIEDNNILNKKSKDDVFRIVTCSQIRPLKRLDFIAQTLNQLGKISKKKIEWFHIGGGKNIKIFKKKLLKILSKKKTNLFLLGNLKNKEVFEFYKKKKLDLFLSLSLSEGRPVSMLEAMSVGLPIFSTNVGGVSELVDNEINGKLVNVKSSSKFVAKQINHLIQKPTVLESMRKKSRSKWTMIGNSKINNKRFVNYFLK